MNNNSVVSDVVSDNDVKTFLLYNSGPYTKSIENIENDIQDLKNKYEMRVSPNDMGLSDPKLWDLDNDRKLLNEDPLIVAQCTNIDHFSGRGTINF